MYVFEGSDKCRMTVRTAQGAHADSLDKISLMFERGCGPEELLLSEGQTRKLMGVLKDGNDHSLHIFDDIRGGGRFVCTRAFGGFGIWALDLNTVGPESSSSEGTKLMVIDAEDEGAFSNALAQCLEKANANTGVTELRQMEYSLDRIHSELLTVMNSRRAYLKTQGCVGGDPFYEQVRAMRAEARELRAQVVHDIQTLSGSDGDE